MTRISHQFAASLVRQYGNGRSYAAVKADSLAVPGGVLSHTADGWIIVAPVAGGSPDEQDGPITISQRSGPTDTALRAAWDAMGGDALMDSGAIDDDGEVRNEWPSEHGDSEGECFATVESFLAPDGHTYHALMTSYWNTYISPWVDTDITLYRTDRPAEMESYRADVAEWEAKPELHPDYEEASEEDDTDPADDGDDEPTVPPVSGGAPSADARAWSEALASLQSAQDHAERGEDWPAYFRANGRIMALFLPSGRRPATDQEYRYALSRLASLDEQTPISGGAPSGWDAIEGDDEPTPFVGAEHTTWDGTILLSRMACDPAAAVKILVDHNVYATPELARGALEAGGRPLFDGNPNGFHRRVQFVRMPSPDWVDVSDDEPKDHCS